MTLCIFIFILGYNLIPYCFVTQIVLVLAQWLLGWLLYPCDMSLSLFFGALPYFLWFLYISSCIFPSPALESVTSPRRIFRNQDLGKGVVIDIGMSLFPGPLCRQNQESYVYNPCMHIYHNYFSFPPFPYLSLYILYSLYIYTHILYICYLRIHTHIHILGFRNIYNHV